ncbi:hypothetical protein F2Q69_00031025 [Brassica cretica]|uniref:Uncharacterized protein n=1 Tax=Brassica cretica TaxID=69181 RepID=A0A8S9RQ88_BRACR|nr:hypothetical protein F2Q69_00031025 [Brassica cretica]
MDFENQMDTYDILIVESYESGVSFKCLTTNYRRDDTSLDSATRASPVDGSASPEDGSASPASPISESKSSASVKVVNSTVPEPNKSTNAVSVKVMEPTVPDMSSPTNVATVKVALPAVPEPTINNAETESPIQAHPV